MSKFSYKMFAIILNQKLVDIIETELGDYQSGFGPNRCGRLVHMFLSQPVHETATYMFDDTRGCVMQFSPPDDEHMCSKHVEA